MICGAGATAERIKFNESSGGFAKDKSQIDLFGRFVKDSSVKDEMDQESQNGFPRTQELLEKEWSAVEAIARCRN